MQLVHKRKHAVGGRSDSSCLSWPHSCVQARRLLTELIGEHLIKTEEIQDESGTKEP